MCMCVCVHDGVCVCMCVMVCLRQWPFSLATDVQPVALSLLQPYPLSLVSVGGYGQLVEGAGYSPLMEGVAYTTAMKMKSRLL